MGKLSMETVARLLTHPLDRETTLRRYALEKGRKLRTKHPADSEQDRFERYRPYAEKLVHQACVARMFFSPQMKTRMRDQSPDGVAATSEELAQLVKCVKLLKTSQDAVKRVEGYSRLTDVLVTTKESVVRNAVSSILKNSYEELRDPRKRTENLTRPLAVAIGLRFKSLPQDRSYKDKMSQFLRIYFEKDLKAVAKAVEKQHGALRIKETTRLLHECMVAPTWIA